MTASALRSQIGSSLADRFGVPFAIQDRPAPETLPTGVPEIDALTGGIPRGSLTEILGAASSGRTSLLHSILAEATARREFCALVDADDAFDPASAAKTGVELSQVLWIRCAGDAEKALKAADLIVQGGGFGLIVMDLADTPPQTARRISLASWFRLRHAVERTPAALVVLERQLNAKSCSALQLEMRVKNALWSGHHLGKLLCGLSIEAESRKHYRSQTAACEFRR